MPQDRFPEVVLAVIGALNVAAVVLHRLRYGRWTGGRDGRS
jgi:hypothetical protein